jgi:uncharacterized protein YifE (UPF0438 family)
MNAPPDHQALLRRKDFKPEVARGVLDFTEITLLRKYGHWLNGLVNGTIKPVTLAQKHFLQVHQGESEPETDYERVWRRYQVGLGGAETFDPLGRVDLDRLESKILSALKAKPKSKSKSRSKSSPATSVGSAQCSDCRKSIGAERRAAHPKTRLCAACAAALDAQTDQGMDDDSFHHSRRADPEFGSREEFKLLRSRRRPSA